MTNFGVSDPGSRREPGWLTAQRAFVVATQHWTGSDQVSVGRLVQLGKGMGREAWSAELSFPSPFEIISGTYVALIPRVDPHYGSAPPESGRHRDQRVYIEARLIMHLASLGLPLRIPRRAVAADVDGRAILVRDAFPGVPLDMHAGRQGSVRPWEVIGRVAATVHAIDPSLVTAVAGGFPTRRAHALDHLRVFDGLEVKEAQEARAWAVAHLPDETPARLLHGDLLSHNVLVDPKSHEPAVIDWEHAGLGDPAFDLAVVTRGERRPFHLGGGLGRLLDAYAAAGGVVLGASAVRLHELCLAARWVREAVEGRPGPESKDDALGRLRRLLGSAIAYER